MTERWGGKMSPQFLPTLSSREGAEEREPGQKKIFLITSCLVSPLPSVAHYFWPSWVSEVYLTRSEKDFSDKRIKFPTVHVRCH